MKKLIKYILSVFVVLSFSPLSTNAIDLEEDSHATPMKDVTFVQEGQDVTAYTGSKYRKDGSVRTTANGNPPKGGDVAMKSDSFIPFGSTVKTSSVIKTPDGVNRTNFSVQDWGVRSNLTTYAIDVWWGFCRTNALTTAGATPLGCSTTDTLYQSAIVFGKKKMDLTFTLYDR